MPPAPPASPLRVQGCPEPCPFSSVLLSAEARGTLSLCPLSSARHDCVARSAPGVRKGNVSHTQLSPLGAAVPLPGGVQKRSMLKGWRREEEKHTPAHTCTHMYAHAHTQAHTDTRAHTWTHMHRHAQTDMHTYKHAHTQTHKHVHIDTCPHTDPHKCTDTHTWTDMHTRTHKHTYRHVHTRTHTCRHAHIDMHTQKRSCTCRHVHTHGQTRAHMDTHTCSHMYKYVLQYSGVALWADLPGSLSEGRCVSSESPELLAGPFRKRAPLVICGGDGWRGGPLWARRAPFSDLTLNSC